MSNETKLGTDRSVHTDEVMKQLWLCLEEDFASTYKTELCSRARSALQTSIKEFRGYSWPSKSQVDPNLYKWLYQLENLFKRYRFENDVYGDAELERMAVEKFDTTQIRIAKPLTVTPTVFQVLQKARSIITRILGDYDREEHKESCRFGKRACVGTPYRESYLDVKMTFSPLTGSAEHVHWFMECMADDRVLSDAIVDFADRVFYTSALHYTSVPKSWKAFRGMMPDTLLGSFYTAGLGRVLERRLKRAGLNIRKLQKIHAKLVRKASRDRKLVTADLSSASDSLTLMLLRWLLPVKWYRAIVYGRARYVKIDDRYVLLSSIVTMGLGSTFPLQTLIFYGLIKAMGELVGRPHYVSVYGDDLIYSKHLHPFVVHVFDKLHLKLNGDKTYVEDNFRESCGCDCYRGVDVRPYQPEGGSQRLTGWPLASFFYRTYNGLTRRWDPVEIPRALGFLTWMAYATTGELLQVPPSYPDGAGIKVCSPVRGDARYAPVFYDVENQEWVFLYLLAVSKNRIVQRTQLPYYWEALRRAATSDTSVNPFEDPNDSPTLRWVKAQRKPKWVTRSDGLGKVRRLIPVVSKKGSSEIGVKRTGISCWS